MISDLNTLYYTLKPYTSKGDFCIRTIYQKECIIYSYEGYLLNQYFISEKLSELIKQNTKYNFKLSDIKLLLLTNRNNKLNRI